MRPKAMPVSRKSDLCQIFHHPGMDNIYGFTYLDAKSVACALFRNSDSNSTHPLTFIGHFNLRSHMTVESPESSLSPQVKSD
jgi:hypothetical protein